MWAGRTAACKLKSAIQRQTQTEGAVQQKLFPYISRRWAKLIWIFARLSDPLETIESLQYKFYWDIQMRSVLYFSHIYSLEYIYVCRMSACNYITSSGALLSIKRFCIFRLFSGDSMRATSWIWDGGANYPWQICLTTSIDWEDWAGVRKNINPITTDGRFFETCSVQKISIIINLKMLLCRRVNHEFIQMLFSHEKTNLRKPELKSSALNANFSLISNSKLVRMNVL